MKKNLIVWTLLLVILIVGASVLYNYLSEKNTPDNLFTYEEEAGKIEEAKEEAEEEEILYAPDFTVYDREGNAVKLSDFLGKPVVLNFWASWCPPCQREMPDFEEKYLEYKDEIHFVMVNLTDGQQETKESAEKFLTNTGYSFPVYFDSDLDAAYTYGVYSVPKTFFIDKNGVLITGVQGAINAELLEKGIEFIY